MDKIEKLVWDNGELTMYFDGDPGPWTIKMFIEGTRTKDFLVAIENHLTKQVDKFNGEE
jgi:hypothetical protein